MKGILRVLGIAVAVGLLTTPVAAETNGSAAASEPVAVDLEGDWGNQLDDLNTQLDRRDWFESVAGQTFHRQALILEADRNASDVVLRRTQTLLTDLAPKIEPSAHRQFAMRLKALRRRAEQADIATRSDEDRRLFIDVCRLRREIAFANPLLDFDAIVFLKSRFPWFQHCCYQYYGSAAAPGGGLFKLSKPFGAKPQLKNLLAGSTVARGRLAGKKLTPGSFISLSLSYDASTVFFDYTESSQQRETLDRERTRWNPRHCRHVFKASSDGSNLTQLTDGVWNDFDPCPLPNGRLVFISERRGGFGRCHTIPMPIYTLHSMRDDGSDIVPLSYHETNEWHPSVNNDGMIVYTRWDYIDRGDCIAHHPWITYPDGRDPRAIQGNYPVDRRARPDMEMHVRAIPDSHRYVSTAAGHHRLAYGSLIVIDPRVEDDGAMAPVRRLTPDTPFPESEERIHGVEERRQAVYRYGTAWPLNEYYYLAIHAPAGRESLGIYLLDAFGNRELIYRDPDINCLHPTPLKPRTAPPKLPHATTVGLPESTAAAENGKPAGPPTGTIACMNVYAGRKPWPPGTKIERLRVIQLFPKATYCKDTPNIGIASESLARGVLGTVPVEEDGSVYFRAPAKKTIYFQALDAEGLAVQSMMSATYVHPGERLTCQGCHESKPDAPAQPTATVLALRRPPSKLRPDVEGSYPVSFPRLVQPILDKHCVACHQQDKTKKAPDLTGESVRGGWSRSFVSLKNFAYGSSGKPPDRQPVRTTPGRFGARASRLYEILQEGHYKVKLPPQDMARITLWLDCNSNFYGAYHEIEKQCQGEKIVSPLE